MKTFLATSMFVSTAILASGFFLLPQSIDNSASVQDLIETEESERVIAGGIVPHHLLADEMIKNFFQEIGKNEPSTIVLVSPDHWGMAQAAFTTTSDEEFLYVDVDRELIDQIEGVDIKQDDELLALEHGLTGLVPYLQNYSPGSKIVPVAISQLANSNEIETFVSLIVDHAPKDAVVVSSTDFSHYLPSSAADFHDIASINALQQFDFEKYEDLELDCWQCVHVASYFAQETGFASAKLLEHSNSAKILDVENQADETTSYVTMLFKTPETLEVPETSSILFLGDTMLGRHVETLMKTHGDEYPFENIHQFLRGIDFVFANLEGPITYNHYQTPSGSTSFSFSEDKAKVIKNNEFDAVSLANNHTLDRGKQGFEDTHELLDSVGIDYSGHAVEMGEEYVLTESVGDQEIVFASFNFTFPFNDPQAAYETVQSLREESDNLIIVNVHWGPEYQLTSNQTQKNQAHALIDAGADVIIGHHPHVVQEIEEYEGKIIFYSLGNFIFDQYFSKNTQEGLAVGLELADNSMRFRLFPLESEYSQIELMPIDDIHDWFQALADRSDVDLSEQIKSGIIQLDY